MSGKLHYTTSVSSRMVMVASQRSVSVSRPDLQSERDSGITEKNQKTDYSFNSAVPVLTTSNGKESYSSVAPSDQPNSVIVIDDCDDNEDDNLESFPDDETSREIDRMIKQIRENRLSYPGKGSRRTRPISRLKSKNVTFNSPRCNISSDGPAEESKKMETCHSAPKSITIEVVDEVGQPHLNNLHSSEGEFENRVQLAKSYITSPSNKNLIQITPSFLHSKGIKRKNESSTTTESSRSVHESTTGRLTPDYTRSATTGINVINERGSTTTHLDPKELKEEKDAPKEIPVDSSISLEPATKSKKKGFKKWMKEHGLTRKIFDRVEKAYFFEEYMKNSYLLPFDMSNHDYNSSFLADFTGSLSLSSERLMNFEELREQKDKVYPNGYRMDLAESKPVLETSRHRYFPVPAELPVNSNPTELLVTPNLIPSEIPPNSITSINSNTNLIHTEPSASAIPNSTSTETSVNSNLAPIEISVPVLNVSPTKLPVMPIVKTEPTEAPVPANHAHEEKQPVICNTVSKDLPVTTDSVPIEELPITSDHITPEISGIPTPVNSEFRVNHVSVNFNPINWHTILPVASKSKHAIEFPQKPSKSWRRKMRRHKNSLLRELGSSKKLTGNSPRRLRWNKSLESWFESVIKENPRFLGTSLCDTTYNFGKASPPCTELSDTRLKKSVTFEGNDDPTTMTKMILPTPPAIPTKPPTSSNECPLMTPPLSTLLEKSLTKGLIRDAEEKKDATKELKGGIFSRVFSYGVTDIMFMMKKAVKKISFGAINWMEENNVWTENKLTDDEEKLRAALSRVKREIKKKRKKLLAEQRERYKVLWDTDTFVWKSDNLGNDKLHLEYKSDLEINDTE